MLQQQQRRRRPADQRHHFDSRTPWLQIFTDEMLTRARLLRAFATADRHEDFLDQVEDAERLFAGLPSGYMGKGSNLVGDATIVGKSTTPASN